MVVVKTSAIYFLRKMYALDAALLNTGINVAVKPPDLLHPAQLQVSTL